jgi:hypothetical protein
MDKWVILMFGLLVEFTLRRSTTTEEMEGETGPDQLGICYRPVEALGLAR